MTTSIALLVIATAVLHASWNFAARKIEGNLATVWLSLLLAGLLVLPLSVGMMTSLSARAMSYLAATAIVHAFYFLLLAKAYETGEISLVYPIARGTGVGGTSLVLFLLAIESIKAQAAVGILAVCGGIFLIGYCRLRLNPTHHSPGAAVVLAFLVGLSVIGYNLLDKLAVSQGGSGRIPTGAMDPLVYICGVFLGAGVLMTPWVLAKGRPALARSWQEHKRYIGWIGPASLCTYLPILFAYQKASASSIVAFREFSVVIGSFLGFAFLGERLTVAKCIGIGLITLGLVLIKLS